MQEKILIRSILNKVRYENEVYLRAYNIDESDDNKGNLISLRLFHEVQPNVYLPFFNDKKKVNQDLIERLKVNDATEDIILTPEEIELFLVSMNLYIENTYDVVKNTAEKLMPGYKMMMYKEYMNIFYVVMVGQKDAQIFEVKIDKDGKVSFLFLENNLGYLIITRDFCKHISRDMDMYIKTAINRYVVVSKIMGKDCFLEIDSKGNGMYGLKSDKVFSNPEDKHLSVQLNHISDKFDYIAKLEVENREKAMKAIENANKKKKKKKKK